MMPTDINSAALKQAWAMVWTIAAVIAASVPIPTVSTSKPNCDMVEYANSSFKSSHLIAVSAPKSAVIPPQTTNMTFHN